MRGTRRWPASRIMRLLADGQIPPAGRKDPALSQHRQAGRHHRHKGVDLAFTLPGHAQDRQKASKQEAEKVLAAIKQIGCETEPDEIQKEKSGLFEIDDANCKIGQYDIKVTPDFTEHYCGLREGARRGRC
jgi:hypothetical protein